MPRGNGSRSVLAGAGEGITFGLDTPVTVTFGSITTFFGTASLGTKSAATALDSFASGNTDALAAFNFSQLANVTAQMAAHKIPGLNRWSDSLGNLAEQGADLAVGAKEACR